MEEHQNVPDTQVVDDSGQIGKPKAGFKHWNLVIYFSIALVIIVVVGYFLLKDKLGDGGTSPKLRQVQQMVNKVRKLESEIQDNQNEIFTMMRDYTEKNGEELPSVNLLNLSKEEKEILEEKIKNEKDVSTKGLLQEILEKNNDIDELKAELERLEALLPTPHVVQRGENHYQISMDYLLNQKNLDKEKAEKLIERALLFDPLVPGFKVWHFYSDDEYGTFITQGTAAVSPNQVRRTAKKKLVDARDKAISERDQLADDIASLEERRNQIISQLDLLNREKQKLITQLSSLNKENIKMQETINSLFYMVETKKNLKKRGIIKGGFLRSPKLKKVSPEFFTLSIDMRKQDVVEVNAADLALKKIKDVTLYPKYYKEGIDYKIEISEDKQQAKIILLNTLKLKNERVVISVN